MKGSKIAGLRPATHPLKENDKPTETSKPWEHPVMSTLLSTYRSAIALTALVLLLAFTATSANAGPGYLYVGEYDSTATTEASVDLPINAQTVSSGS